MSPSPWRAVFLMSPLRCLVRLVTLTWKLSMYETFSRMAFAYAFGTPVPAARESRDLDVTLMSGVPDMEGGV
jgi:hypothetical protein